MASQYLKGHECEPKRKKPNVELPPKEQSQRSSTGKTSQANFQKQLIQSKRDCLKAAKQPVPGQSTDQWLGKTETQRGRVCHASPNGYTRAKHRPDLGQSVKFFLTHGLFNKSTANYPNRQPKADLHGRLQKRPSDQPWAVVRKERAPGMWLCEWQISDQTGHTNISLENNRSTNDAADRPSSFLYLWKICTSLLQLYSLALKCQRG